MVVWESGGTGLTEITTNYNACQRWVRTLHQHTLYTNATFHMVDMLMKSNEGDKHKDMRPSEIRRSERNVKSTIGTIESFLNRFVVNNRDELYCISSGAPTSTEVEIDVLGAEETGEKAKEEFIKERLFKKEDFFEPLKRKNLKTFADKNKIAKVRTTRNKIIEYKQQGNIAFRLLVQSQCQEEKISMTELMTCPLTPILYSIGTADGLLLKTDKAKGFHYITKGMENKSSTLSDSTLVIYDGNAMFYCLNDVPNNFKQISLRLLEMTNKGSDVVFSTDMYLENSIKSMERSRRGTSAKLIIKGENTKRPADRKKFLTNDENKEQFIEVILKVWSSELIAPKLVNRKIIMICAGRAYPLNSEDGKKLKRKPIQGSYYTFLHKRTGLQVCKSEKP